MIERTFLPWSEPVLPAATRHLADRHTEGSNLALGDVLVVLPGRRAGRRLVELLVEEAERRDLVLAPPRTTTVGALPEFLYDSPVPLADRLTSRLGWADTLLSLDPDRRSVVFPDPPRSEDLAGWLSLASLVSELHRETAGEWLGFGDVARVCRTWSGFDDGERWSVLADVQGAYVDRLEDLGCRDRDVARLRALEEGSIGGRHRELYLVGVVEMPTVLRGMLGALEGPVRPLIHAPEERSADFDELGCVLTEAWSDHRVAIDEAALSHCGRPPSQADEAVRRLSGGGRSLAPDEVTVGVPDEDVVPYLEQRFRAYGVPHRYAAGTPLERADPYRFLSAVADYLEGSSYVDFAALLRHPVVARVVDLPAALATADEHFHDRLPARVPLPRDGARPGGGGRGLAAVARSLEARLRLSRLTERRRLSEWAEELLALLRRTYGDRLLDRSVLRERQVLEALEELRDAAAGLRQLPDPLDRRCSGATAVRAVLSECRDGAIPPPSDRSAVELLGWLELHLDDAPVLVVTGMNEGKVPASVGGDAFLPDGLRGRLGLVDDERRYARDLYLLSATIASREETHFVVGRRSADGDPLRPSRLLLATEGEELAERALELFSEERSAPASLPRLAAEPGEQSGFRAPPEPVISLESVPDSLRVTDFRLLLRDPYRWALENVLGLEALDDQNRELDPLQFGGLAHEVLHRFGEEDEVRSSDPEVVRHRLHALLDEAAARYRGALPAVRLQVEQLRARLSDFAVWQAARVSDGWETVAVEVGTLAAGLPLDVDGEPIGVRGRIDRVDRHRESGRWEVLDYKTSGTASDPDRSHRRGGQWVDLQLPLYRHLVRGLVGAGQLPTEIVRPEAEIGLGFVNLSREGAGQALASWDREQIEDALETARDVVRLLREGEIRYREDDDAPGGEGFGPLVGAGQLARGEGDDPHADSGVDA